MLLRALTRTGRWLLYLLAGLLVLIALLVSMARFAVFHDGDYSERLASLVSRYVGSPVEIDQVDLVWDRFDAVASLKDVRILASDGKDTDLILPSIELELNLRDMLLQRNLSVRKVQLKELSLLADYKGHGELEILGREIRPRDAAGSNNPSVGNNGADDSPAQQSRGRSALTWLFNADRIAILDSSITLTDRTRNTTHSVDNVDIRAFNDGDLHQIRISSSLPDAIGNTSVASFDFTGSADDIQGWSGQFYIDTRQLNLGEITGLFEGNALDGMADLKAWGRWRGTRLNEVRLIGSATGIDLQPLQTRAAAELAAERVEVDLDWKRSADGWRATFNRLGLTAGSDVNGQLDLDGLVLSESRERGERSYRIAGPAIDLVAARPLMQFAASYFGANHIAANTQAAEQAINSISGGVVADWQIEGRLDESVPVMEQASLNLRDVQLATEALKIERLDASVELKDNAGRISLDPETQIGGSGGLFARDMPTVGAAGVINFAQQQDSWVIGAEALQLRNKDIRTRTRFNLRFNPQQQRLLDSITSVDYINLAKAKAYLPAKGLKPNLRKWLNTAILGGDVVRGQITVSGDLADFAPAAGRGAVFGEVDIVDSTVKFRPDWPVARQMDGNLTFNATSMRGRVYQGAIREARFSDARMFIADFKQPLLELQTNAIGPLDDMLDFAQRGPLASKIGSLFGNAKGVGASRMELDLLVPLRKELRDQLKVDGAVLLENAQVNAQGFGLDLESVTGKIRFNRQGVLIDDLLVRYLGIPLTVNATQTEVAGKAVNSVKVIGPVAISSVLGSYGIPLTESFDGISNWRVSLDVTRSKPGAKATVELSASSDLTGTMVDLPVPFYKDKEMLREAKIYRNFSSQDKDWWVDLPGLAQMRVRIGTDKKLESMAIALGRSNNTVLPWRGLAIHGDIGRLDALGWFQFANGLRGDKSKPESDPFPLFAKVVARSLQVGEEAVGNGVYIAFRDGDTQVHRIENPLVNGEVRVKLNASKTDPIVLRLDNLDRKLLTAFGSNRTDNNVTNRPLDPRVLPPIDAIVKELKWDNWRFLRVAVRTVPAESGLKITSLTARQDSMRVSGNGQWFLTAQGNHATELDLNASVDNVGRSVSAVGGGQSFADGAGEAALSLTWPDAAYRPDLKTMSGTLYMSFRNGRVLGIEPGAGRILGLFALQALPRRLAFDFRDIVKTGLEYSTINGNFTIGDGRLASQTLLFTGPAAEILIHGYSDFSNRTYNQTVDVLPRVSGALPLIGVLSGGPAAGVTALVADGILKGLGVNLDEIGRRRFTLTGSWEQPQWETVELQAAR